MEILFVSAKKIGKNTIIILNCCFHNKFILCHIKPNIYIYKTKFVSHKQELFSLLTSRNAKKTHIDQSIPQVFFTLSEKNRLTNL